MKDSEVVLYKLAAAIRRTASTTPTNDLTSFCMALASNIEWAASPSPEQEET